MRKHLKAPQYALGSSGQVHYLVPIIDRPSNFIICSSGQEQWRVRHNAYAMRRLFEVAMAFFSFNNEIFM